nr:unnamed protein product [Callosobruchus analis]
MPSIQILKLGLGMFWLWYNHHG